jgi:hypothetical protein
MRLVSDWKKAHRWFSVQALSIATAATVTWQLIPDDLRSAAPSWVPPALLVTILFAGIAGRLVEQK